MNEKQNWGKKKSEWIFSFVQLFSRSLGFFPILKLFVKRMCLCVSLNLFDLLVKLLLPGSILSYDLNRNPYELIMHAHKSIKKPNSTQSFS